MGKAFLKTAQRQIINNIPTILSAMAAVGTVASVCLASEASLKAKEVIEEKESKNKLSKADKALIYVDSYLPTALMTTATLICIFGSNHVNKQRMAGIAGAYILSENALSEYKDKVDEMFGSKKAKKLEDEIKQDHISKNPPNEYNTVLPPYYGGPDTLNLWWDEVAKRYFYCSAERIRKAELRANKELHISGFVSINDIYEMLELPPIKTGDDCGWEYDLNDPSNSRNREVSISIEGGLTEVDTPCGVMDMDPWPNSSWLGL